MISYNGYKTNCITIENGNAKVGDIVSIDSDGKIYKSTKISLSSGLVLLSEENTLLFKRTAITSLEQLPQHSIAAIADLSRQATTQLTSVI